MTQDELREYKRCMDDFEYFASKYLIIPDKIKQQKVPFILFPTQKKIIDCLNKHDRCGVLKYRQAGATTTTCAYLAHKINFTPDVKVAVVANKLTLCIDQVFKMVTDFIANLPDFLRVEPNKKNTSKYKVYENGSEIMAFAAGKDGIRGFSPDIIFIDEAAHLEHGDEFWTAMAASTFAGGQIILNSTPNGHDPVYHKSYEGSISKQNNFVFVDIKWYEDPRYGEDLTWVRGLEQIKENNPEKYRELELKGFKPTNKWYEKQCKLYNNDRKKIAQEIEGSFLGSGGTLIDEADLTRIDSEDRIEPIRTEGFDNNVWIFEDAVEDAKYLQIIDVSSGKGEDYTAIQILRIHDDRLEQVMEYRAKITPELAGEIGFKYGMIYNQAYTIVDVTGSYGVPTVKTMLNMDYKNIHYDTYNNRHFKSEFSQYANYLGNSPGFVLGSGHLRNTLCTIFESKIRNKELIIHSARTLKEMREFVWHENLQRFDHQRGSHDDLLIAVAIGAYIYQKFFKEINKSAAEAKNLVSMWSFMSDGQKYNTEESKNKRQSRKSVYGECIIQNNNDDYFNHFEENTKNYRNMFFFY